MTTETTRRLTLDDVLIVDADVHVHESPEALLPYMDPTWRPALENLGRIAHRNLNIPGFCPLNFPQTLGTDLPAPVQDRPFMVWDGEQMRRDLDRLAIDVGILFPDNFLKLAALPRADYATALTRAYHRWLAEHWLHADNDLYAMIMAIPQDPAASAREIERWARHDRFVGVYLPTCEVYPMWGHRQYDPILEVAERYDLPVLLHAVGGLASGFPYNNEQFYTGIATHTCSHVFAMMANLMNMMETGVPVRFPNLRICFAEAGLTWVPFLRMRLDKEHNEWRYMWPFYGDRPSKWIQKFYFATQPVEEPEKRRDLTDIIRIYDGEDTTIFASDWPHHDFDHPRAVFELPIPELMKRKVMGANALRLMPKVRVPVRYQHLYRQGETL